MSAARPLRDIFDELAGGESAATGAPDPRQALSASGHDDLPDPLLAEAIVNYADTAPLPVAEQLAPFVRAHSPVPEGVDVGEGDGAETGLELLATTPPEDLAASADVAAEPELTGAEGVVDPPARDGVAPTGLDADPDGGHAVDPAFGAGQLDHPPGGEVPGEAAPVPDAFPDLSADPHDLDFGAGTEPAYDWDPADPGAGLGLPDPDSGPDLGFGDIGAGPDREPPEEPAPELG